MFSALIRPSDAQADPPDELLCPITYALFQDPVVCEDGFTYDRQAIERWLQGNGRSPMTNNPLRQKFVPNQDMKRRVLEWKEKQQSFLVMPSSFHLHDALYVIKSPELDQLSAMIRRSLYHLSEQFRVVRIERNVNEGLWKSYAAKRKVMTDQGVPIHEAYGFHACTSAASLDAILQQNFDPKLSKIGPCGKGIYMSSAIVYPIEAKKITWTDKEETQVKIIATRVVLGNCVVGTREMLNAPYGAHSTFALAMGGHVFCVYNSAQTYSELVVHLMKVPILENPNDAKWMAAAADALARARATKISEAAMNNPLIELYESPLHPCKFGPDKVKNRKGKIVGKGEDEKIAVLLDPSELISGDNQAEGTDQEDVVYLERAHVVPDDTVPIAFPWKKEGIRFSARHLSRPLMEILAQNVEGLTATKRGVKTTFFSVFLSYRLYGIAMFFYWRCCSSRAFRRLQRHQ